MGIPTGLISAAASILQKAGLLYTTPARYAFLENLSCLVGCFVLAGGYGDVGGFGIGEILCALAAILYAKQNQYEIFLTIP